MKSRIYPAASGKAARKLGRRAYQIKTGKCIMEIEPGKYLLVVGPPGSGKTVIIAKVIRRFLKGGLSILVVAATHDIIKQTYNMVSNIDIPEKAVGVLMAMDAETIDGKARVRPDASVQVASIQTLISRGRKDKPPSFDVIIIDEAHHAVAESYMKLQEWYPDAIIIGMTATPSRYDGTGLGYFFNDLYVIEKTSKLIKQGYLVQPIYWGCAKDVEDLVQMKLKGIRVTEHEYVQNQLVDAMGKISAPLIGNAIKQWKRINVSRDATVGFAVSIGESKKFAERFNDAGISAEHIDMNTLPEEREAIYERLRGGETKVVWCCKLLEEGWDEPCVRCVILACPTKSDTRYVQTTGRVMRIFMGRASMVLDLVGNFLRHPLPHEDREYSLNDRPKGKSGRPKGSDGFSINKSCPNPDCGRVSPNNTRECPECHHTFGFQEELDAELQRIELEKRSDKMRKLLLRSAKRTHKMTNAEAIEFANKGLEGLGMQNR